MFYDAPSNFTIMRITNVCFTQILELHFTISAFGGTRRIKSSFKLYPFWIYSDWNGKSLCHVANNSCRPDDWFGWSTLFESIGNEIPRRERKISQRFSFNIAQFSGRRTLLNGVIESLTQCLSSSDSFFSSLFRRWVLKYNSRIFCALETWNDVINFMLCHFPNEI